MSTNPSKGVRCGSGDHGVSCGTHFRRAEERPFTAAERDRVTVLFGGLTERHERFIHAAITGLGYRAQRLPVPTKSDYQTGREYANYGMCNPTYFTVGALVNFLQRLRDEQGLSPEQIIDRYVFVTGGSCGPCRYGAYESEHRLALRNSGFDGFRVIAFEQRRSVRQSAEDAGFALTPAFFLGLVNSVMLGDVLNAAAYQIRPYETTPGSTDAAFEPITQRVAGVLREKGQTGPRWAGWTRPLFGDTAARLIDQLAGDDYVQALREGARRANEEIDVDYTQPKPVCKVIGEIWAQTTEGDGNFRMFSFLESQGCEVIVEPLTTWLDYLVTYGRDRIDERYGIENGGVLDVVRARLGYWRNRLALSTAEAFLKREHERIRMNFGGTVLRQADQRELQRLAAPHFNPNFAGGEGYLEVAKNVYYGVKDLAHMVLSVKPFGCMPSTQSDGAQASVLARYPGFLFLPVETSGDGDINAYSRVQMMLAEAKQRCIDEFRSCVQRSGYALEDIRAYVGEHRELRRPFQRVPRVEGVAGRGAAFVLHAAKLMDREPRWRERRRGTADVLS